MYPKCRYANFDALFCRPNDYLRIAKIEEMEFVFDKKELTNSIHLPFQFSMHHISI